MSSTDAGGATSVEPADLSTIDMNLEVVTLPVADVDRAKDFYASLGWRFDIDLVVSDDLRTVQFTPPHSQSSIQFGKGRTTAEPGSAQAMILVVDDIDAARAICSAAASTSARSVRRGRPASSRRAARTSRGPRSATRTATAGSSRRSPLGCPAANGRIDMDVASLADLLHETSGRHGAFEAVAPPHDWWDWYAAYIDARQRGSSPGGGHPLPPTATWPRSSRSSSSRRSGRDELGLGGGQGGRQLPARADPELREHLVQVPLDGARAEVELRADLAGSSGRRGRAARCAPPGA